MFWDSALDAQLMFNYFWDSEHNAQVGVSMHCYQNWLTESINMAARVVCHVHFGYMMPTKHID